MRAIITFTLLALTFGANTWANEGLQSELHACGLIKEDPERLSCFDGLTTKQSPTEPATTEGTGDWVLQEQINPVDDSKSVVLQLEAESGVNRRGQSPTLLIRCISNNTDVLVWWHQYLGNEGPMVLSRMGEEKARTERWRLSNNRKSSGPPSPINFVKEMLGHNSLVLRVTPYGENSILATFNTSGLSNAIEPIRETCNW